MSGSGGALAALCARLASPEDLRHENDAVRELKQGFRAAFRGMGMAFGNRGVRKAYVRLILAIVTISGVIDVLGLWGLFHFTEIAEGDPSWQVSLLWIARVLGTLIVLVGAPILGILVTNICFPFFNEHTFMAGMRAVDERRADEMAAWPGNPLRISIGIGAARLLIFLCGTVFFFLIGLIPVVGNVLGLVLGGWFAASIVGWEMLEPYFDRHGMGWAAQRAYIKQHRWTILGFALPISLMLAIPIIGPLFFGIAQAGAAWFVRHVLEGAPEGGSSGPQRPEPALISPASPLGALAPASVSVPDALAAPHPESRATYPLDDPR